MHRPGKNVTAAEEIDEKNRIIVGRVVLYAENVVPKKVGD
jgi:hypothetical protein